MTAYDAFIKNKGQLYAKLVEYQASDLSDAELDRSFANCCGTLFCVRLMQTARDHGITIGDLYAHFGMVAP